MPSEADIKLAEQYRLQKEQENKEAKIKIITIGLAIGSPLVLILLLVTACMVGCPRYNVYQQRMEGEAQLAHAEYSKKVQVQDALGKLEAAKSLAQAEVERAKGVAQANAVIGDSLKNNEAYLRWLYIEGLKERTGMETVYIPTESGLPILEASRKLNRPMPYDGTKTK